MTEDPDTVRFMGQLLWQNGDIKTSTGLYGGVSDEIEEAVFRGIGLCPLSLRRRRAVGEPAHPLTPGDRPKTGKGRAADRLFCKRALSF